MWRSSTSKRCEYGYWPSSLPLISAYNFRENQETYTSAGGFEADDDEHEERRARINEARQRSEFYLVFSVRDMTDMTDYNCLFQSVTISSPSTRSRTRALTVTGHLMSPSSGSGSDTLRVIDAGLSLAIDRRR